jgi:hypothetical protein
VLDEHWPFSYLQLYCDATVDEDPDLVVDVMMAVGGRISGEALGEDTRRFVKAMAEGRRTRRAPLSDLRDLRHPAPPPPHQRPGGRNHLMGLPDDPLGRRQPEVIPTDRPPVGVRDEPAVRHDPRLSLVG